MADKDGGRDGDLGEARLLEYVKGVDAFLRTMAEDVEALKMAVFHLTYELQQRGPLSDVASSALVDAFNLMSPNPEQRERGRKAKRDREAEGKTTTIRIDR